MELKQDDVECVGCEKSMVENRKEEAELVDGRIGIWYYFVCRKCNNEVCIFQENTGE